MMEFLDFPEEILMEIMSKLDQKDRHLTAALVCKRFLHLTRSPQLQKCVKYQDYYEVELSQETRKLQSLLVMLRDNKNIEKVILTTWNVLKILKVVAPHGSLRHLELNIGIMIPMNNREEWKQVFSQICTRLTSFRGWEFQHP
jgi:hypothetical protein